MVRKENVVIKEGLKGGNGTVESIISSQKKN